MTPFQRKIRSLGHSKYLPFKIDNLPPQLEPSILEGLVISLREQLLYNQKYDRKIRNRIVEGHARLGVSIASRFGYKYKFKIDDLIGEMFLNLIESTIKFCMNPDYDNNITPYLVTCIHSRLSTFIENDKVVYMPGRTVRYYSVTGNRKLDKLPNQITLITDSSPQDDEYEETNHISNSNITPQTIDDHSESEVLEILDKVTNNFIEKRIIELRAEGYSYKEISPLVGYSQSSISIMVRNVEEKFYKIYKVS